jgi:phosphoribosylglycinamide formyltransferase-1
VARQREMARRLRDSRVDLVVLAGFDRILAADFFAELRDVPVIATHPSLLPRFGGRGMIGLAVHEAVLRSGDAETGCTIFRVRPDRLDDGEVIVQRRVSVLPGDTSRTLEERVLHQEHRALVEAVRSFSR